MENRYKFFFIVKSFECLYLNCKCVGKRLVFGSKDGFEWYFFNCKFYFLRVLFSKLGVFFVLFGVLILCGGLSEVVSCSVLK